MLHRQVRRRGRPGSALAAVAMSLAASGASAQGGDRSFAVVADAIPASLTGLPGDPARGRAIVVSRQTGLCLLCHSGPFPEEPQQGTLATDLAGVGSRWSEGQLRLRLVDARRLDPMSIMPAYHRTDGLVRVAAQWQGRPLLDAQQIEDLVALLRTLRDRP